MKVLPKFVKKPIDKRGEVIATERGWVVVLPSGKEEVLWCINGLKSKLEALQDELKAGVDLQDAYDIKSKIKDDLDISPEEKEEVDKELFKEVPEETSKPKSNKNKKKKQG